jgi:hypothetical protein
MRMLPAILIISLVLNAAAFGQQRGLPALLDDSKETALAESAAPAVVAKKAAVYVLRRGGFVRLREGSNGFTCFVARSVPEEIEPICYLDTEHTGTLVAREFEEQKLREQGLSNSQVDAAIGKSYREGQLRAPQNFGLAHMLSPCNRVLNGKGEIVGEPPHLMFYAPYATNAQLGLPVSQSHDGHSKPFILFEGQPWAFLIVPGEAADPSAERFCKEKP